MVDSVVDSPSSDSSLADLPGEASAKSGSPTVVTSDTPLDQSANDPTNRPISTIPADLENQASTPMADYPVATASASMIPDQPIPADSVPSISIDQSANSSSQPTANMSVPPLETTLTPQPQEEVPVSSPISQSTPTEPVSGGSIQDLSQSNQPIQEPSSPPTDNQSASSIPASGTQPESAEIKTELPQDVQNAPLAESEAKKSSFGDLIGKVSASSTSTPSIPPISQISPTPSPSVTASQPKTSYGDLNTNQPTIEPTINIEPIESPKPVTSPPPQSASPQSPLSSPSSPETIETVNVAKADFSSKRTQALQNRRKKRDDHLAEVLNLVSQKNKINNEDVCKLLRVSQSTATNYLHALVKDGKLKKEGKGKSTIYLL